jgi:hypothetical protein
VTIDERLKEIEIRCDKADVEYLLRLVRKMRADAILLMNHVSGSQAQRIAATLEQLEEIE